MLGSRPGRISLTTYLAFVLLPLLCVCLLRGGTIRGAGAEEVPLRFSYITTKTGGFVAAGAIPAVDLALAQINNRSDILPNYTLGYTDILDSQCDGEAAMDAFMQHFREDPSQEPEQPTYLTLRCCGCSTATIPVADFSHYWNIPMMAGIAGANELNDRRRFKNFFRTDATSEFVGPAVAQMARQFGWTQMAVVTQSESLFLLITESLNSIFTAEQRVLDTSATIERDVVSFPYQLLNWERDYRIVMLNTGTGFAYTVLCEAYYRGWRPPEYVWITYSWFNEGWWQGDYGNSSCTPELMRMMVNGSLAITPEGNLVSDERDVKTISGLTPAEYEEQYDRLLGLEKYQALNLTKFIIAGSEFDATWAMALGLHNASERVRMNHSSGCDHLPGALVPLEQFDYLNDRMGCVLHSSFQNVEFRGITGMVRFNSNGSRDANIIRLQQYRASGDSALALSQTVATVVIGLGTNDSQVIFNDNFTTESLWKDGPPYDGAALSALHPNHKALVVIYSMAAACGLVYTVVCLVFNVAFGRKKVVKLSSPNLNYLVILGSSLLYVSVFLYVFSSVREDQVLLQTLLCNIRQWLFSLGYTLCFAVILAKTWRVYYIFFNPTSKKKIPKDWFLLVIVSAIIAMDLSIILIGTALPSSRLKATPIPDTEHPFSVDDDGITYENFVFVCLNRGATVWLAISYAYKGLLQLVAVFMAFHTRRVKIRALNDSKEIAVIIYINSITLTLLIVVEFALYSYHEVYAALFGLALLTEATVFLSLIFIPKMVQLARDPKGETVLQSSARNVDHSLNPTAVFNTTTSPDFLTRDRDGDEVGELKKRLKEMERKLAKAGQQAQAVNTEAHEL